MLSEQQNKYMFRYVVNDQMAFVYKDKSVKIRQVAKELGVRYVLEGSVRKAGNKVRINAQLIDATTGHHLWAKRYDGEVIDIFALQDRKKRFNDSKSPDA